MIGLLFKDFLCMKKAMLRIALILGVYVVIFFFSDQGTAFISSMIILLSTMLVMNAFAYDEISKWDYYALSLPITKKQLVLTRYLLTLLMSVGGLVIGFIPILLRRDVNLENLMTIYAIAAVALILSSIMLPLLFKFGSQKARIWVFIICLFPTVAIVAFSKIFGSVPVPQISESLVETLVWFSLPAALIILAVSFLISCSVMTKKEL